MNVLFIYPLSYCSLKGSSFAASSIHLGISYISAILKEYGHKTELLVLSRYSGRKNLDLIDNCVKKFSPGLICFTSIFSEYFFSTGMAGYIKSRYPNIYLLIGGPHVSLNPDNVLSDAFDALCIGEGEYPVLELVSCLEKGRLPSGIPNLWIKQPGGIEKNNTRPFLEKISELPFPDRQIWDAWTRPRGTTYSVILGRGCPFQCTYCSNHALRKIAPGNYVRFRSPDNIIEEIREMSLTLPIKGKIFLEVETIAVNKEWAMELCAKLETFNSALKQPLTFGTNVRIVPGADLNSLFAAMRKCNIELINFGLESGSEKLRREVLKRDYSNQDVIDTVKLARKHKLKIGFYNMVGIPGETAAEFRETVRINRRCLPDWYNTYIFCPYPGTVLHHFCSQQAMLKTPLNDDMERQHAVLDFPGASRRQINKRFVWFGYHVYKGHRPLYKILKTVFILRLRIIASFLILFNNDKFIKRLRKNYEQSPA
ncbi:MAG: radical SAM protein [Candidatus Omnitrophota bacterium]